MIERPSRGKATYSQSRIRGSFSDNTRGGSPFSGISTSVTKSRVLVNDANAASAPSFVVFNARVGATAVFGRPWLQPVLGVQNLFDKHYVGSVAVNASGATLAATKFYEPAPGRTWLIGLSAATNPW